MSENAQPSADPELCSSWAIPNGSIQVRVPVAYWFFVGWRCVSLGVSFDFTSPNVEIHLPFGFVKIGFVKVHKGRVLLYQGRKRAYGFGSDT